MYHFRKVKNTEQQLRMDKTLFIEYIPTNLENNADAFIEELHRIKEDIQHGIKSYYDHHNIYQFRPCVLLGITDLQRIYQEIRPDTSNSYQLQELIGQLIDNTTILDMYGYGQNDLNYTCQKELLACQASFFRKTMEAMFGN